MLVSVSPLPSGESANGAVDATSAPSQNSDAITAVLLPTVPSLCSTSPSNLTWTGRSGRTSPSLDATSHDAPAGATPKNVVPPATLPTSVDRSTRSLPSSANAEPTRPTAASTTATSTTV